MLIEETDEFIDEFHHRSNERINFLMLVNRYC